MRFTLEEVESRKDIDFKAKKKRKKKGFDRDACRPDLNRQFKNEFHKYIDITYENDADLK